MLMGAQRNPKVIRLQRLLGFSRKETVGALELLWLFVMEQAPRGDVGKWSDDDISAACDCEASPKAWIEALVTIELLDRCEEHRLVVHDWAEHATEFLQKRHRRALKAGGSYFVRQRRQPLAALGRNSQEKPSHAKPSQALPGPVSVQRL